MNWIEIDRYLMRVIARHTDVNDMLTEIERHFKWNRSQSVAAVGPLLERSGSTMQTKSVKNTRKYTRK